MVLGGLPWPGAGGRAGAVCRKGALRQRWRMSVAEWWSNYPKTSKPNIFFRVFNFGKFSKFSLFPASLQRACSEFTTGGGGGSEASPTEVGFSIVGDGSDPYGQVLSFTTPPHVVKLVLSW